MVVEIALAWALAVLLCALRFSVVVLTTPVLAGVPLPGLWKILFLFGLSAVVVAGLPGAAPVPPPVLSAFVCAAAAELVTGATLAFAFHTAFGAVSFAGKLIDVQVGFGIANVYDPVTHSQAPVTGALLGMLAMMLFYALDMHLVLFQGLAHSLRALPLGQPLSGLDAPVLLRQFGLLFSLGLMIGAPLVFALFLIDIALGVLSRGMPQMNMFAVGVPVKIAGALLFLLLMARQFESVFARVFASIFQFWERVL